jgi:hypothetical protein
VEIRQHVETIPTVSKELPVGSIIVTKYDANREAKNIITFEVVGKDKIFRFVGKGHLAASPLDSYTMGSTYVVIDNPITISYLLTRAKNILRDIIQECEDGVFDD